ncbi:hypothetical protein ARMSODRAFT_980461 [Armillaria solidipes]|uniref:Uncharacterized protein n=1 Tax=Armillaria solidipes TaxID=1076256 RepID=A0A2H3BG71_9AGAR|nr:hypothetical protein ARMSODRAFT_980461 [Armillaria solidipes]
MEHAACSPPTPKNRLRHKEDPRGLSRELATIRHAVHQHILRPSSITATFPSYVDSPVLSSMYRQEVDYLGKCLDEKTKTGETSAPYADGKDRQLRISPPEGGRVMVDTPTNHERGGRGMFTIATPRRLKGNEISERGSAEAKNKGRGIAEYMLNLPGCDASFVLLIEREGWRDGQFLVQSLSVMHSVSSHGDARTRRSIHHISNRDGQEDVNGNEAQR